MRGLGGSCCRAKGSELGKFWGVAEERSDLGRERKIEKLYVGKLTDTFSTCINL